MEYKAKKLLTVPVLKLAQDEPRYVKITGAMHVGKPQKAVEGQPTKEPATLANCVNLEDGTECQIIVSAVVKSVLTEEYPADGYVGKCFRITKQGRNAGKQYNSYDIVEIEDPGVADAGEAAHGKGGKNGRK